MTHSGPGRRPTGAWALAAILLLIAVLGTLIVPIYARATPALGSFPFFYWYQLLWVPVVALLSWAAFLLTRPARSPARARRSAPEQPAAPADPGGDAR
jgi:membrane protein implicated in regulation of membrane protease activity